ncbi:hypothetical protein [Sphingomonas sp. UBA978]|uniref:hypothetical protein n=1 Tax=Sphingomonas sp. UBA978 TaxID=1947536 RepID=UPI0025EBC693|nr:hypothetical protein [Sphingomonas sp. UBA978]
MDDKQEAPPAHAIEAAARAMCDRVNGIGDYCENIEQRRAGWVAQARAGINAYLAAAAQPALDAAVPARRDQVFDGWSRDDYEAMAHFENGTAAAPKVASDTGAGLAELVKPFADYHGDLPDYNHPLRPTFESGIQYAVELLAKELGVKEWVPCDGTEEFDGDLGGTLMNIVLEAMPKDEDGDPIHPRDLVAALATDATDGATGGGEVR